MNWSKDKSITLSLVCVAVFAALLLALDIFIFRILDYYTDLNETWGQGRLLLISIYTGSIPGWITLAELWRLLINIKKGKVFESENVRLMRIVSWCCAAACLICLVSTFWYLPFLVAGVAAGFMALIVRIVKNAFQQAVAMKGELDLTI